MEPLELQIVELADNQGHRDKAKQLNMSRLESASELISPGCLQLESAVEVLSEDIFDDKSDLDEEHTPEKAIIQCDFGDRKNLAHSLSDNESNCSSYRTQFSRNRLEKLQDGFRKHEMIKHVATSEQDHLQAQAKAISVRLQNCMWHNNRTESGLVQMLWRQMKNLALREKEMEQTLSKERIESLVSKVEEEVEFEGMVEDMCSRFKAEGEYLDIERRERDWERERREVRLEEEVERLRNKVETLEEEIRIAHAERDCAMQKQTDSRELFDDTNGIAGALQGQQDSGSHDADDEKTLTIVGPGHSELLDGGEETLLAALKEMLCQAEEKAEKDCRMLEESFQDEQQLWIENEQLLQNRISSLERELNSTKELLKDKEALISLERERRREYGLEFDRVLAFWREENSVHSTTLERLKHIEMTLVKSAERIKQLITIYPAGETEFVGLLSELLMDLEKADNEKLEMGSPSNKQQLFELELIERWKSQRDLLEEERDKLQEKLELATEMARNREESMEKLWQEKEMNFVKQLSDLKALVGNDDAVWNRTNAMREKGLWESEVAAYKQAWQEECDKVQSMITEREQVMEEHTQEWSAVLEAREEELCALKSGQKKLANLLITSKKRLLNLKRQMARHRRGFSKDSSLEIHKTDRNSDNIGGLCSDESDLDTSCSTDMSTAKEGSQSADGEDYCMDLEQLANDIFKEIGRLAWEYRQEQEKMERERTDVRIGTQQLKDERKELEGKVAEALNLMEDMREQIRAKEGQMERERKQMDLILNSKTDEAEHLKTLLNSKDHEIERAVQKFKEELNLVQKEVEKERKEREDVMDMHFTSRRKIIQEMKEKEARWEKEIEAMSQEVEQLRRDVDDKNQLILKLKKEGGGLHGKREVEWQDLIGKIAGFDNQIADAMLAIRSLKEELTVKEKELQRARLERDSERKVAWIQEQAEPKDPQEHSSIVGVDREINWGKREHLLLRDNEDLIKLLEAERGDTADAMSILQGAVRELQWALKHSKGKGYTSSLELDGEAQNFTIKGELVKVHTSHLEELDEYILDLKLKVEEAEKRARTAEVALAVNTVKEAAKTSAGTASALVKIGKDWVESDRSRGQVESSPARVERGWGGNNSGSPCFQSPVRKQSKIRGQGIDVVGSNLRNFRQDQRWSGVTENAQLWDINATSPGQDASSNSSSSSGWLTVRGGTDDSFVMQDPFQQGPLTLAVSTPPPRSQRRWLVDAHWLENVRKEQTSLRQQLDIERQRVSALKQVEAENRWMEATIVEALEQKKDSDSRVLELEQKVAFLESMISKKGVQEKSPMSSSVYRGAKS